MDEWVKLLPSLMIIMQKKSTGDIRKRDYHGSGSSDNDEKLNNHSHDLLFFIF